MTYIILEVQTTGGESAVVPALTYTDRDQAESKFHLVLSAAAVSSVEEHTCMMLTADGKVVRSECYKHPVEPTPEPEPEGEPL